MAYVQIVVLAVFLNRWCKRRTSAPVVYAPDSSLGELTFRSAEFKAPRERVSALVPVFLDYHLSREQPVYKRKVSRRKQHSNRPPDEANLQSIGPRFRTRDGQ